MTDLPTASPESQGIDSRKILAFLDTIERQQLELHSFMLLRHGHRVAEGWWAPYQAERAHVLYSLSKSFTSTAIGFAIQEGRLSLDDRVVDFFPDKAPAEQTEFRRSMRVRDLLTMATGQEADSVSALTMSPDGDWVRTFLSREVTFEPGSVFLYNSGATYMLSAILQKLTGERLVDYLRPRLLDPLGIGFAHWEQDPRGIDVGGWGLRVTTESIARFGQFYLQKGAWRGQQLLNREWIELATAKHIENGDDPKSDWNQGYGFQFWRCRPGCYRGDGAFGQFCVVNPAQGQVIATTSGCDNMQAILDAFWEHLSPSCDDPLPENPEALFALQARLATLRLPVPATDIPATLPFGTYRPAADSDYHEVTLTPDDGGFQLTVHDAFPRRTVSAQWGEWRSGEMMVGDRAIPVAAYAVREADGTVCVRVQELDAPAHTDHRLTFLPGGELEMTVQRFGTLYLPPEGPTFRGLLR